MASQLSALADRIRAKRRRKQEDPVSILADPSPRRRWETAARLARSHVERDEIITLVGALADEEPFVRWQAGRTLASLGRRSALEALLPALRTPPVSRQAAAAEALGMLRDQQAGPELLEAARSQNVGLRVSAIEALGRIGASGAGPLLMEMLRDESAAVRKAAASALGQVPDGDAEDALLVRLRDEQEHVLVRRAAAWALAENRPSSSGVPQLTRSLDDPDPQVRWYVAQALGLAGDAALDDEVASALLARVGDEGQALQGHVSKAVELTVRRLRRRRRWRRVFPSLQSRKTGR
jgi:HEAT repeat protein